MLTHVKRIVLGRPLHSHEVGEEKLPKWKALPIFSSDALSSVGYGPEQIAIILAVSGMALYGYFGYVAFAILVLLGIITLSYTKVAGANPNGGGSYSITLTNMGEIPALIVAAALFADYTLTVAVSVCSGTEAIVSAFQFLRGHEILLDVLILVVVLMVVNLRGTRESANIFIWPTYLFVASMFFMIVAGIFQALTSPEQIIPASSQTKQIMDSAVLIVFLRAFANGCSSMTGVEAIADGVPSIKEPRVENAVKTTWIMAGILGFMLAGISFLIIHYHIIPVVEVTVLSQLAEAVYGRGGMYYFTQIMTMLVLYLAANTSYNGLPILLSIMARDGYMPRYLGVRGDRLSFSNGIILLTIVAVILIVVFDGNVSHLVSLYALGVFLSFTFAQLSLVIKWRKEKPKGWKNLLAINLLGTVITTIVVIVIAVTKFWSGAWIVVVFIPLMVLFLRSIKRHYRDVAQELSLPLETSSEPIPHAHNIIVIPVSSPTQVVARTIQYAKSIGDEIIAVHLSTNEEDAIRVKNKWESWNPHVRLEIVHSPFRYVIQPLIDYIDEIYKTKEEQDFITVIIPEFETKRWWHRLLHNQTGWVLRTLLILRKNVVVTTIPYHLRK